MRMRIILLTLTLTVALSGMYGIWARAQEPTASTTAPTPAPPASASSSASVSPVSTASPNISTPTTSTTAPTSPSTPTNTSPADTTNVVSKTMAIPQDTGVSSGIVSERITLMTMITWGGVILWITMFLGFVGLIMAVYFLLTITPKREVPANFLRRVLAQIRSGDLRGAYQMCEDRDELLVNVIRVGLRMSGHDRYVIQDAMESEGERGVTALWQKISYLSNIGSIAPLLGLLGTVWGMVLAFSNIAADNAQVRGIVVAENVSKAMITTVGGLVVAIPCLTVYYYLRGRVVKIVSEVEAQASEVIELLSRTREVPQERETLREYESIRERDDA